MPRPGDPDYQQNVYTQMKDDAIKNAALGKSVDELVEIVLKEASDEQLTAELFRRTGLGKELE